MANVIDTSILKIDTDHSPALRGFKEVEQRGSQLGKSLARVGADMSRSFVDLGTVVKSIGPMLASAFTIGGIAAAGKQILDFSGHVSDLAARLGVSTTAVQHWESAFGPAGVSIDTIAKSANILAEKLATGDESALAALKAMGVSLQDLKGLSPEAQFNAVADAVGRLSDQGERVSAAKSLFGKGGVEMLSALDGHLRENIKSFDALGLTISETTIKAADDFGDQLGVLGKQMLGVVASIVGPLLPALSQLVAKVQEVAQWVGQLPASVKVTGVAIAAMGAAILPAVAAMKTFGVAVEAVTGAQALGAITSVGPSIATAIRNIGTAASQSAVFMGALNAAATGLAVTGFVALAAALRDLAIEQGNALADAKTRQLTEPLKGLNGELRYTTQQAAAAAAALPPLTSALTFGGRSVSQASLGFADLKNRIAAAAGELSALSATEREQLAQALRSTVLNMEDVQKATGLSADALALFKGRMEETTKAAAHAFDEVVARMRAYRDEGVKVAQSVAVAFNGGLNVLKDMAVATGRLQIAGKNLADHVKQLSITDATKLLPKTLDAGVFGQFLTALPKVQAGIRTTGGVLRDLVGVSKSVAGDLNAVFQSAFEGGGGVGGAIQSLATKMTSGLLNLIPAVGPVLSQFAGAMVAGVKRLFGGPSAQELAGRDVTSAFQSQFSNFGDMMTRVGDAYAQIGRSAQDAQRDVAAMFEAQVRGADAARAAVERVSGVLEAQDRLAKMASQFGPSQSELQQAVKDAADTLAFMERTRANWAPEQIGAAYAAWQKAMADAGNAAAAAWVKAHDAAQAGAEAAASAADATSQAMQALVEQRDQLAQSFAGEAAEDEMGVTERAARAQVDAINAQIEAMQRQAEEAAAAAQAAAQDTSTQAAQAADEASSSVQGAFAEFAPAAEEAKRAIDRILADMEYRVKVGFDINTPAGSGIAWGGAQAKGGDYTVRRPTLFLAGEAGPERVHFGGAFDAYDAVTTTRPIEVTTNFNVDGALFARLVERHRNADYRLRHKVTR